MGDCYTFREELAIKYPTLGHALWEPDPGGLYDAVQVGDVGLIRGGCFHRLFNTLLPRDHPSNPHPHDGLNYPEQLQPRMPDHIRRSRSYQKVFRSKSVTQVAQEPNIFALGPDDDASVTFSCSTKQGALISLPFPTECEDTVAFGDFTKWMVKNIDDCMRLADDLGWGVNRMEDMILVTGRHLTKSWANVAFSESRVGAQVSFCVRVTGTSGAHLEERNVTGGELKLGPNGENLPENQCIFVRGYRVIRILGIWPRLRAMAGPAPDIHEPEPESATHLELISIPSDANRDDPLHILLDYIAEKAPDCELALVHDDDLKDIVDGPLPVDNNLRPDSWKEHIRNCAPDIHRVQCELSHGSKSEKGVGVRIARVATLSADVFTPPRENMDTPQTSEHYEHPLSTGLENRRDQQKQAYAQTPLFPSESPASLRPKFHLSHLAYTKPILHSLKHHNWFSPPAISGVLLGLPGASQAIVDAVPLYHGPHHMLEDALQAVTLYARSRALSVVGYYQTNGVGDTTFDEHIVSKINKIVKISLALVLNRDKLDESGAAFISYIPVLPNEPTFHRVDGVVSFDRTTPAHVKFIIDHTNVLDKFRDFEDCLNDDSVPFLENSAVQEALNSIWEQ